MYTKNNFVMPFKLVVVLLVLLTLFAACKEKSSIVEFKANNGITINYFSNWEVQKSYGENVFLLLFATDNSNKVQFHENIKLEAVPQEGKQIDFNSMVQNNKKYAQVNNIILLEEEITKIDGKDAFKIVFDSPDNNHDRALQFLQIFNNTLYILTFSARKDKFDSYRKQAEETIRSIKY